MTATFLSAICLRMPSAILWVLASVVRTLLLPTATVASVLAIAFLMNYCGATATLGLTFSATGALFPFFSSFLGWLGVFLTGSDTSANALFGSLQVVTANRLGLDPVLLAATNSAGGVMGKMISLQTIAVAAAATGLSVADQVKALSLHFEAQSFTGQCGRCPGIALCLRISLPVELMTAVADVQAHATSDRPTV